MAAITRIAILTLIFLVIWGWAVGNVVDAVAGFYVEKEVDRIVSLAKEQRQDPDWECAEYQDFTYWDDGIAIVTKECVILIRRDAYQVNPEYISNFHVDDIERPVFTIM
jgi:hypothetical protein